MTEGFDLLLRTIERDLPVLAAGMPYLRAFLRPARITLVAPASCLPSLRAQGLAEPDVTLLDEDAVVPGLRLDVVRGLLAQRGADPRRAGWYFQQLLSLAFAERAGTSDHYLAWDSDTIPLRPITFFDRDGRVLVARKPEFHAPYFRTLERLLGLQRQAGHSFIAEHMMFDRALVRELLAAILGGEPFAGPTVAARILGAVADEDLPASGFSEYETYGNFVLARHPGSIATRAIRSSRRGSALFGRSPGAAELFALSTRYHWASFEAWPARGWVGRSGHAALRATGRAWAAAAARLLPARLAAFERIGRGAAGSPPGLDRS